MMSVIRAVTNFASFIKILTLKTEMDDSNSRKDENIPTHMKETVRELTPEIALRVLNDYLQMFNSLYRRIQSKERTQTM